MTYPKIELELTPKQYEKAGEIAKHANVSLNAVIREYVTSPFALESTIHTTPDYTVDDMESYNDIQLWIVVSQPLAPSVDAQLSALTARSKEIKLSAEEEAELEHLIGVYDKWVLWRSTGLMLLKQRGYDIEAFLNN